MHTFKLILLYYFAVQLTDELNAVKRQLKKANRIKISEKLLTNLRVSI